MLAIPGSNESWVGRDTTEACGMLANITPAVRGQLGHDTVRAHCLDNPAWLDACYFQSKDAGYRAAWSALDTYARDCPTSKLVLLGYSQGAHIAGDLVATIATEASPVSPARISTFVLLADPARSPTHHTLGAAFPGIGAAGARGGFGDLTDRVVELCVDIDPGCNAWSIDHGLLIAGLGTAAHQNCNNLPLDGRRTFTTWITDHVVKTLALSRRRTPAQASLRLVGGYDRRGRRTCSSSGLLEIVLPLPCRRRYRATGFATRLARLLRISASLGGRQELAGPVGSQRFVDLVQASPPVRLPARFPVRPPVVSRERDLARAAAVSRATSAVASRTRVGRPRWPRWLASVLGDLVDGRGAGPAQGDPHDERPAAFDLVESDPVDLGHRKHEQGAQLERGDRLARRERQRDAGADGGRGRGASDRGSRTR
ncbi:hypothetical protein Acsp05_42190 [Actinokineospora sp. NBRC 105648]|nr:hypothetical protein Acsp05_42190 [Actinokineospora sp. NBRC 105648]